MTMDIQSQVQPHEHHAMKPQPKWQDWSILVLAGILFISPYLFGTVAQPVSSWNAWIVGVGMVFFTIRTFAPPPGAYANQNAQTEGRLAWWQKILDSCHLSHIAKEQIVVGAWLLVSPWVMGFAANGAAAWTAWTIGTLIVVLATWKLRELRGQ